MRKWTLALTILFLTVSVCGAEEPALKTQNDKISYAIGLVFGKDMKTQGIDLDADLFFKGFKDSLAAAKPMLTDEEVQQTMTSFRTEMTEKKKAEMKKAGEENKKTAEAFFAENKKKEGVQTLPSGLQYKIEKEGDGKKPTANDTVTVNYRGTLVNGTEFDSSYKRNQPATFPVSGVIPGWTEALQLMKTGSKWHVFIPSNLAYGETGAGGIIPPNAALIFEVELLSIAPPDAKTAPRAVGKTPAQTRKPTAKPADETGKPAAKPADPAAKKDK